MRKSAEPHEIREVKLLTNQVLLIQVQLLAQGLKGENSDMERKVLKGERRTLLCGGLELPLDSQDNPSIPAPLTRL